MSEWDYRHPSVGHFQSLFSYAHLPEDLQPISVAVAEVAETMLSFLEDGPELSAGLRKLVEAKDCFVRQAVMDRPSRKG